MSSGGEVVIKITGDDSEYEKKLNGLGTKAKLHTPRPMPLRSKRAATASTTRAQRPHSRRSRCRAAVM